MGEEQGRYQRAKSIVLAAEELGGHERVAFVEAQCAGDPGLLEQVRGLLAAIDDDLEPGPLGWIGASTPSLCGSRVDATSGSGYRILSRLGQGGMGVVHLAERMVGGTVQQVALKLLDPRLRAVPGMQERFERETRILASLSHDNIARLLDAGDTREGHPFLAMEYVKGERIDRWCASRALSLERKVRLFLQVCAAVQYAHQHLVIHRDIKPANILVDGEGVPKLLDFGIARLMGEDGSAGRTETGLRAMTLACASPEQIRNEPLSTASDVWQLGVVLYELVSGVRPFPHSGSPLTLSHAILSGELDPPGQAALRAGRPGPAGRSSASRVPRDIDAIVLKALRVAPRERYASVEELAGDLQRFLESRPVLARRGQRWYRAQRFAKRYRGGIAVAALAGALLSGLAIEREAQFRRVEVERDKAQVMAGFMREVFEDADPSRTHGNRITMAEALDLGVERLHGQRGMDPEVKASLLLSIGRGYNALDMGDRAIPLLREADALLGSTNADVLERGRTKAALGRAYSMVLDTASSIAVGSEAIALLEQAPDADADEVLRIRINLLFGHINVGDKPLEEVAAGLEAIVAELRQRASTNRELLVQALAALAMARLSGGEDALAIEHAGRALAIAGDLYGAHDPALIYYRFTASLALIRTDPARAVREYRQLISDYERMSGAPTPGLGVMLAYFGWALDNMGQHEDAAQALRRAVDVTSRFAAMAPDFHLRTLTGLAAQYHLLGRDREALALLEPQRRLLAERARAGTQWGVNSHLQALNVRGGVALRQGNAAEAEAYFRQALEEAGRWPGVAWSSQHAASREGLCALSGAAAAECG